VTPDERWLAAVWPFVRASLPAAPARAVEIGCGPLGGLVPMLQAAGYRERFDEATARWCFARLPGPDGDPGWLHHRRAEWRESGQPWDAYLRSWAETEGLHAGQDILDELDARFDSQPATYGPYFFPDLAGTSEASERAAIDSGLIQANRIQYVGRRGSHIPARSA
jgi:hypothetical protein